MKRLAEAIRNQFESFGGGKKEDVKASVAVPEAKPVAPPVPYTYMFRGPFEEKSIRKLREGADYVKQPPTPPLVQAPVAEAVSSIAAEEAKEKRRSRLGSFFTNLLRPAEPPKEEQKEQIVVAAKAPPVKEERMFGALFDPKNFDPSSFDDSEPLYESDEEELEEDLEVIDLPLVEEPTPVVQAAAEFKDDPSDDEIPVQIESDEEDLEVLNLPEVEDPRPVVQAAAEFKDDPSDDEIPVQIESDEEEIGPDVKATMEVEKVETVVKDSKTQVSDIKAQLMELLSQLDQAETEESKDAKKKASEKMENTSEKLEAKEPPPQRTEQETMDLADSLVQEFENHIQEKKDQHTQARLEREQQPMKALIEQRSKLPNAIEAKNTSKEDLKAGITALKETGAYQQLATRGKNMGDNSAKVAVKNIDQLDGLLKMADKKILPGAAKQMINAKISNLVNEMKSNGTLVKLKDNIPRAPDKQAESPRAMRK